MGTCYKYIKGARMFITCLWIFILPGQTLIHAHNWDDVQLGTARVNTQYGYLRGIRASYKGQIYDEFRGIPFAQPPVGPLRWERPSQPSSWTGDRDATEHTKPCTQLSNSQSQEDCLYLNVYVPFGVKPETSSPKPVMVWVHGGGMLQGSSNGYCSEELVLKGNVILVMFNYRLSVLGALSTSDSNSPGNYMLWDARAALLWVRDNIANFGGDSSRVTLFGQSAGGTIVSHIATSPMTKGLIHRVISMSGGSSGPIAYQHRARNMAQWLAEVEECPVNKTDELVRCLRGKEARDLDASGYISSVLLGGRLPGWLPVKDGQMLADMPKDAWRKGAAAHVDYMVGRCENDAASFVFNSQWGARGAGWNIASDKTLLQIVLLFLLQTYTDGNPQVLIDAILKKYPDLDKLEVTPRTKAAVQITTDFAFASSVHYEAESHSMTSKKNTYMYNWHYRPSFVHYEPWVQGSHNDDLHFVFGEPYMRGFRRNNLGNFSVDDYTMRDNVMSYYTNFAHTGNPNKGPNKVPVFWPKYDPSEKRLLEFAPKIEAKMESPELLSRLDFWLKEWPKITIPDQVYSKMDEKTKTEIPKEVVKLVYNATVNDSSRD